MLFIGWVGLGQIIGIASCLHEELSRNISERFYLYLHQFAMKIYEQVDRQERPGIKSGISCLPVLSEHAIYLMYFMYMKHRMSRLLSQMKRLSLKNTQNSGNSAYIKPQIFNYIYILLKELGETKSARFFVENIKTLVMKVRDICKLHGQS